MNKKQTHKHTHTDYVKYDYWATNTNCDNYKIITLKSFFQRLSLGERTKHL